MSSVGGESLVRAVVAELERVYEKDAEWTLRFKSGQDEALAEVIIRALAPFNITPEQYEALVASDPSLGSFQSSLISDMVLAPLNPGPSNPLARESAGARWHSASTTPEAPRISRPWWRFW